MVPDLRNLLQFSLCNSYVYVVSKMTLPFHLCLAEMIKSARVQSRVTDAWRAIYYYDSRLECTYIEEALQ